MATTEKAPKSKPAEMSRPAEAPPARRPPAVFKNVLCAVDGTRGSMAAVRIAASLLGAKGHLTLLAASGVSGSTADISPARAGQVLERARLIAEKAGVAAGTVLDTEGRPVEVILKRAAEYDLLAMGPPASSWLGGMLLGGMVGGVASAVLSRFSTPVLIVRGTAAHSLKDGRILVASDGEPDSDRVVDLGAKLGRSQGAAVTLVNALEGESHMNPRHIQAQMKKLTRMQVNGAEPIIEAGNASEVILKASKSDRAALLVMGTRRLSGLRALGSVSRRVAHDAGCSVLLLPPAA